MTGHACAAYGYPAGHDGGVWSEPEITGQTVDRLQLTAQAAHGHQIEKGFSGTGLFDTETGAVVGLVVTRDKGKDVLGGFAIPLQAVAAAFPQLGPWVGWRLGTDRFLRQHWRPRARGVYQDTTPGWYFTGRTALLRELTGWLEAWLAGPGSAGGDRPGGDRQVGGAGVAVRAQRPAAARRDRRRPPGRHGRPGGCPGSGPGLSRGVGPRPGRRRRCRRAGSGVDAAGGRRRGGQRMCLPLSGILTRPSGAAWWWCWTRWTRRRTPREIARQLLLPLARDLGVKVLAGTRPGRDEELLAAFGERAVIVPAG